MAQLRPAAFMSYVHFDDIYERLTTFRAQLSDEVRAQTGEEFPIFQDRKDIQWGQNWKERIDESIAQVTFLIPIITPSFFNRQYCRVELQQFLERERQLGRNDLILPVYYVDCPILNDEDLRATDELAQAIALRHYTDWRDLRFEPSNSPQVGRNLARIAIQIRDVLHRVRASEKQSLPEPPPRAIQKAVQLRKNTQPIESDSAKNKDAAFQLMSLADPLTGLLNRRYLEERLAEEVKRSERYSYAMSCMMIDIDDFKHYNDLNGHSAGDLVLEMVAECLKSVIRSSDVASRYGGEEFSVLLPQTSLSEASAIAERIRAKVEHTRFPHRNAQPLGTITVSIGISTFSSRLETSQAIVGAADRALYVAKSNGKNRVQVIHDEEL